MEYDERYVWGWRIDRAFSPHRCRLSTETLADGLGWYGIAPSVLGFAATWDQRRRKDAPQGLKVHDDYMRFMPGIMLAAARYPRPTLKKSFSA